MSVRNGWRVIRLFADQERQLAVRSRLVVIFAVLFAALALAVGGAGYILTGGQGVQDFARTAVSLVQLVLLLVPLVALLTGVMALTPDRGAAELLYSQPVARQHILAGKLLGLFEALAAAQMIGFGASGAVIFSQAGSDGIGAFIVLVLGSLALTGVFLGLGALVACTNLARRSRALSVALVVWFLSVVLFDVAALGLASMLRSGTASRVLIAAVVINPADAVRTGTLLAIEGDAAFGAASLAFFRVLGGSTTAAFTLGGSVLAWLIIPVLLAGRALQRADL